MTFTYETRTAKDGTVTYSKTVTTGRDPVTGKRRQKRLSAPTVRELKRLWAAELKRIADGDAFEPSRAPLADYLERWLVAIEPTVRATTHIQYTSTVRRRIVPALGAVPLSKLTPLDIQNWYTSLLAGDDDRAPLSPTTVAFYHRVLHRALDQAVKWQLIQRNPCDAVDPPRETTPEFPTWTAEHARAFLTAARGDDLSALFVLALHTGMRRGELLALRWEDVDLERSALAVRRTLTTNRDGLVLGEPKTRAGRRSLALPAVCVDALRAHRVAQLERRLRLGGGWDDTDLVFDRGDGGLLNPSTLRRAYHRLTSAAGVPRIRFHDLRHTAATLMLANGEHPKIVQERLGHSDISMTLNRYSHVSMDMQRDAADRLARLLGS